MKVAIIQTRSTSDLTCNTDVGLREMERASEEGCALIAFPEAFLFLGTEKPITEVALHSPLSTDPLIQRFINKAKHLNINVLLGSVPEKVIDDEKRVYNTSIWIDRTGTIIGEYRKIHLFDLELPDVKLMESSYTKGGEDIVVLDTDIGRVGLTICYDLRFPILYQQLREQGAQIIFVPSAFTVPTGRAHWLPLLRARAIETQCWVIAPVLYFLHAQWGNHKEGRMSYGCSVCIDPWGTVIARAPEKVCAIYAMVTLEDVDRVRERMPVFDHRVNWEKGIDSTTSV